MARGLPIHRSPLPSAREDNFRGGPAFTRRSAIQRFAHRGQVQLRAAERSRQRFLFVEKPPLISQLPRLLHQQRMLATLRVGTALGFLSHILHPARSGRRVGQLLHRQLLDSLDHAERPSRLLRKRKRHLLEQLPPGRAEVKLQLGDRKLDLLPLVPGTLAVFRGRAQVLNLLGILLSTELEPECLRLRRGLPGHLSQFAPRDLATFGRLGEQR